MLRYIILVWNAASESDCAKAVILRRRILGFPDKWRSALDRRGIYIAYVDDESCSDAVIPLGDGRGAILGAMFQSPGPEYASGPIRISVLSDRQSEAVLHSMGRSLVSDYWGHYVAALHYPERDASLVLRAPVSPLSCFHIKQGTLVVFFSYLQDCMDLDLATLSINWDGITAQAMSRDCLTSETAVNEITCLECGEAMECGPHGRSHHGYWDPRRLLGERCPAPFNEAARSLRRATEYCVHAHASRHRSILVKLSGGLDSSIVLSALRRAPHGPAITAINYYCAGSGDERGFARTMAVAANCRLVERVRNEQLDLRRLLDCNRTVRPALNFSAPDVEARNNALARELHATAIFDGELGDNLFGSYPGPGALAESLRSFGWSSEFLRTAMDYAMLMRQSVWRAIALARREAECASREPDFSAARELQRVLGTERARSAVLASQEAEEAYADLAERFLHPWLRQSRSIAPGSHSLLYGLLASTSGVHQSGFSAADDPPQVSPFLSQPLMELVLRLPAFLHFKWAQDRAVARTAFTALLPQEIVQRGQGKGGPDSWLRTVIENNTGFLREFLMEGILVQRRLIDRVKLEAVLSARIVKSTVVAGDILAKLYMEVWLRGWRRSDNSMLLP